MTCDVRDVGILALFTLVGVWMLINNVPHGETVYATFQSGLFLRMQINPGGAIDKRLQELSILPPKEIK